MKQAALVVALGFLLVVGTFGFLAAPAAADMTGSLGGELKVAIQDFGSVDPTMATPTDRKVLQLVYDSLGRVNPVTLEIEPWAATGWAWDGDKNITVTLRSDLRFSDGASYGAPAVARSLNAYMQGGQQRWTAVAVDATTVRLDFTAISPGTYNYKTTNRAGPGLFFTEGLTASIAWDATGTRKYSGPFAVANQAAGMLELSPNVNHFMGRPFLNKITYLWPFTVALTPAGTSAANDAGCALMFRDVHLIGWQLLANDLTNQRDCVASHGGFADGTNKSLLNPDPMLSMPHVLVAKNPGTDFLYFGFSYNAGSMFIGAPNSAGQKLRSAIYQFVNKLNYRDIEPNSAITHGLQNRMNAPWAPPACPPWTPCDVIVDAGFIGAGTAKRTNIGPGLLALDGAGVFDRNGDGIRETAAGTPVSFQILAPSFALDPRKTTIADDMAFQLRAAGLDVTVAPFDTTAALDAAIASCTTCMYVKRYVAASQMPDWLYAMPEIRAAGDTAADLHLNLGAATSWTSAMRALHVGHVSHLVGASADFLPVLHFDALEAFDFQSFAGWVNTFNGINNFWSLTGLRLPALGTLSARVSIFPTMSLGAGDMTTVQAEVRDQNGQAVANAMVTFSAPSGTFASASGMTNANGIFSTTYTAPGTVAATADVTVTAMATKMQYTGATGSAALTLHTAPTGSLVVAVNRGPAAEVDSNSTVTITVQVTDSAGTAVAGADVVIRTDLPGARLSRSSGTTDANGMFTAQFTAVVKQGMTYRISATASAAGFQDASSSASLSVRSDLGTVPVVETTRNVPGFEAAAAIAALGIVFALVALARRRED